MAGIGAPFSPEQGITWREEVRIPSGGAGDGFEGLNHLGLNHAIRSSQCTHPSAPSIHPSIHSSARTHACIHLHARKHACAPSIHPSIHLRRDTALGLAGGTLLMILWIPDAAAGTTRLCQGGPQPATPTETSRPQNPGCRVLRTARRWGAGGGGEGGDSEG